MAKKTLYRISFMCQGQVYEVYANSIAQGALFGFIEIEELVFGERSTVVVDPSEEKIKTESVVVDPSEEKIKTEFEGVKRTHIPMHSVIRIDEVDKQGASKISKLEGNNISQFPMPMYTPDGSSKKT